MAGTFFLCCTVSLGEGSFSACVWSNILSPKTTNSCILRVIVWIYTHTFTQTHAQPNTHTHTRSFVDFLLNLTVFWEHFAGGGVAWFQPELFLKLFHHFFQVFPCLSFPQQVCPQLLPIRLGMLQLHLQLLNLKSKIRCRIKELPQENRLLHF